ncbi:rhodanese-like domain-containing protein [Enterococcus xiangfangensis]|uniref:rhodanese-like domain-containing protein n=1 Tax=Enterococcus xiangfangensis TaxID=1296537 RepID=UPI0010FA13A5|nr:rhodanese-like domain-containing protein [Enterococcus xiangfangensis]MBM7710672.1 rhodanese-related sulfurtransferase [Enterococcus xiangfangensis]NBK08985.1 rhodanese-like domain-containing protein [Enterococcus asini]
MDYSVTTNEFMLLAAKEPVNILDLRDPEFIDSFDLLTGSNVTRISLTQLPNRLHQLDKEKTYYLFTQFGGRSKTMTQFLRSKGFQVTNVIGGMTAYERYLAS